ncbi:MAG: asparagine synthase (glutamine-hydrolyzing) [Gammaproteobacteria bacterium]|nr:asparagine synthase (glutamine-hydrolyzing) [Gammaproteobacteria bacterium]
MCGICGFTGKANEVILKKMTDSIFHRGPDEDGFYSDGKINLGIRRLSIIDVETGHQPIHNEDKSIWTVFNGEIYNFLELRKELEEKGHRFCTDHSDTEVIVHLYEEYGRDFLHKLNGMFAIALWDKDEEKLLLIRDRMGVKPLFYATINNTLIFGSEIKAILSHPDYHRDINYEAVYHYFTLKNIPAPLTAFKEIYSLLPGEIVTFSKGKVSKERWWKIRFQENENYDELDIKEKILALLEDATRLRMRSDVPFGPHLSGGVESSAIVALMTRFSDKPIKTFSLGYEDELQNKEADLYYARKVSQVYKTDHYEYIMSYRELVDEIENVIEAFDQPFSGTISTYFLTRLIAKHVKVALSGDAADELFGSYLSHRVAQPMYHFSRLYDKVRSNTLTEGEKDLFKPCDIAFLEELFRKSKGDEDRWRYHLCLFSDKEKDSLLSEDFKSRLNKANSFNLLKKNFKALTSKDPLNRILEMEWNTQLPDQMLAFADFLSMAHSVEIRSPFIDYRLVEFVATLPGNIKIRNGNVKDILKRTVEPLLPEGITKRPKEGFVLPIFDWMVERLKGYSVDVLSEKRLKRHDLLNTGVVKNILQGYYAGNKSNAGKVWNLMMFQVWWEEYFG